MKTEPNAIVLKKNFEFAALSEAVNYRAAIVEEFSPYLKGRGLEVGAGIGQTTEAMLALPTVSEIVGLEPDPRFQQILRERLPHIRLVAGTMSNIEEGEEYDGAIMVNVLEHIEHHQEELVRLHTLLKDKGGHLCIFVLAREELYSDLDEQFGHLCSYDKPKFLS